MAKIAPRPEPVTVGKYRATPTGAADITWQVRGPGKDGVDMLLASIPDAQFQQHGRRMLEAWAAGKEFKMTEELAGVSTPVEVTAQRRRELLQRGRDHTVQVGEFERELAALEYDAEGIYADAVSKYPAAQWPGFEREMFAKLYGEPEAIETPHQADGWMSRLHDLAGETLEWEQLRTQCRNDPWASGMGAGRLTAALAKEIGSELEKLPKVDAVDLEDEVKALEDIKPGAGEGHQDAADLVNAMAAGVEQALSTGRMATKLRAVIRKTADKLGEELEEIELGIAGLGAGNIPGEASKIGAPRETIRQLLVENPKLRRIAKIAGRLKMRARAKQRTKTNYQPEQVVGVTLGNELQRIIPSEALLLATEETELLLFRKLLERQALQYDLDGREQADQGPVILAVDNSGSMLLPHTSRDDKSTAPNRHEWAMGVALALLEVCAHQKRPFCLVHFDSIVQKTFEVEKPGRLDLAQLVEMVTYFSNGGTNFAPPLGWAQKRIERGGKGGTFAKSDVILVTDGEGSWGEAMAELKGTGALVYGVAIHSRFSAEQDKELAGVAHIADLSPKADGAIELVFGI